MHRNLDANFLNVSEEIVTSQAVLDHMGVSEAYSVKSKISKK